MRPIWLAFAVIGFVKSEVAELMSIKISPNPKPPSTYPSDLLVEGSNMMVNCTAIGIPIPTISLYISGRLVRQNITWHLVTVIYNVTRDTNHVSCYADNGYGPPIEVRKRIDVKYKPYVTSTDVVVASLGDTVTLECLVDADPEPTIMFWRDPIKKIPIVSSSKYSVNIRPSKESDVPKLHRLTDSQILKDKHQWVIQLSIKSITDDELGDYFCHAENQYGNSTRTVQVQLRNVAPMGNFTQCCIKENVSAACSGACSSYLDIDSIIVKTECLPDIDKIMRCSSDGSNHRRCCLLAGVERNCSEWCEGGVLDSANTRFCLKEYANKIISCFRDGNVRLPGPPQSVRVEKINRHSATIKWDPPLKNPGTVEMYRVFWRQVKPKGPSMKNDVKTTSLKMARLKAGVVYECIVKAGNTLGTSTMTEPVRFNTEEKSRYEEQ